MDSYEGDQTKPISLHKYLYAHGDPVNNADPSGFLVESILSDVAIRKMIQTGNMGAVQGGKWYFKRKLARTVLNYTIGGMAGLMMTGDLPQMAPVPAIPDQGQYRRYQDPDLDFGVQYKCDAYAVAVATRFRSQPRQFIAYRLKPPISTVGHSPWEAILSRIDGRNVSMNAFHVGAIRHDLVFDNYYSGVPLPAWPFLYEVMRPVESETSFTTLGGAAIEQVGDLKIFNGRPPTSRWDPIWGTGAAKPIP